MKREIMNKINEYKITFEVISKSNFDSGVHFEASVYISGTDIEYAKSLLESSHLEVLKHLSTIKVATAEKFDGRPANGKTIKE